MIYVPPADFSLMTRGTEAGRSQRWQIYALKIMQGALTAVGVLALWLVTLRLVLGLPREHVYTELGTWHDVAMLGGATFAILVAEKVVDQVDRAYYRKGVNVLDFIVDVALHQAYLLPFEFLNDRTLFVIHCLCFLGYPWSQE
jgi:hypothetical protein